MVARPADGVLAQYGTETDVDMRHEPDASLQIHRWPIEDGEERTRRITNQAQNEQGRLRTEFGIDMYSAPHVRRIVFGEGTIETQWLGLALLFNLYRHLI